MTVGEDGDELLTTLKSMVTVGTVFCNEYSFDECDPPIAFHSGHDAVKLILENFPVLLPQFWPPFDATRLPTFERCDVGHFAEELAGLVARFDMYTPFAGTIEGARRIAHRFVAMKVTPDWNNAWIGRTHHQWGPGLGAIISYTALIITPTRRRWSILVLSNED